MSSTFVPLGHANSVKVTMVPGCIRSRVLGFQLSKTLSMVDHHLRRDTMVFIPIAKAKSDLAEALLLKPPLFWRNGLRVDLGSWVLVNVNPYDERCLDDRSTNTCLNRARMNTFRLLRARKFHRACQNRYHPLLSELSGKACTED